MHKYRSIHSYIHVKTSESLNDQHMTSLYDGMMHRRHQIRRQRRKLVRRQLGYNTAAMPPHGDYLPTSSLLSIPWHQPCARSRKPLQPHCSSELWSPSETRKQCGRDIVLGIFRQTYHVCVSSAHITFRIVIRKKFSTIVLVRLAVADLELEL